jgi:hypothetical protein
LLSNRWKISRVNSNIKWIRSWKEFSINRRRNRKSNITSIAKEIFIKYAEKTNHKKNEEIIEMKIIRANIIQSQRAKNEIKLSNDVIVYKNKDVVNKFLLTVTKFNIWKKHDILIVISSKNHMSIFLKSDWADKIKSNKIYFLRSKERVIVNEIFDNLHDKEKMKWFTNFTSFEYSIFVIYKTIMKDDKFTRKDRAIIDIRKLNAIIVIDVYFMSVQTNIIVAVAECLYIFVMNVLEYFYQWAVKFDDRHKLTIISHKEQKQFNVCVMKYKNFLFYVQLQTNLMLKNLRNFVRAYMNDIIIFFKTLNDHLLHLRKIFQRLWHYNVVLNSKKVFLNYSFIMLLKQIIDVFDLIIAEEKLATIINLTFSISLKELKTYLNLNEYLRVYVSWYSQTSQFLQNRKTLLFKNDSMKKKSRKLFAKNTLLNQFIEAKIKSYEHSQHVFSDKKFLRHCSNIRKFFIDVNIFKKRNIETMIFHVKNDSDEKIIFKRCDIKSIMFLSKILISTEIKYWFTKLKITDVIWVIKKIRLLIETSKKQSAIIFTNHFVLISIIKQIPLNTFNTNKLNLRLVRASQYFFVLSINMKIKFEKFHVISDALSRLFFIMNSDKFRKNDDVPEDFQYDLDALLVQSINEINTLSFDTKFARIQEYLDIYFEQEECLIEMTNVYRQFLLNSYSANFQWNKIREKLQARENTTNIFDEMNFTLQNDLIYYSSKEKTFKFCISWSLKKDIYKMTHDDNHHCEFHKAYIRIFESLYIRHISKRLRRYIHHCKSCFEKQTKRYSSYDELNSIRTMTLSFHTVIIDFVVASSITLIEENAILIITKKFFKRINIIAKKDTWDVLLRRSMIEKYSSKNIDDKRLIFIKSNLIYWSEYWLFDVL